MQRYSFIVKGTHVKTVLRCPVFTPKVGTDPKVNNSRCYCKFMKNHALNERELGKILQKGRCIYLFIQLSHFRESHLKIHINTYKTTYFRGYSL